MTIYTIPLLGASEGSLPEAIRGDVLRVRETLGDAKISQSQEYRFVDKDAYLLKLPNRAQAIWFDPVQTDWSPYAALDFRFYNPGNEEVLLKLLIQSGDDTEAKALPDYISVPSGVISLPRETEVFKRLILDTPEFKNAVDTHKIVGIYLETRRENSEIFLEGFHLLTRKEIEEEAMLKNREEVSHTMARIKALQNVPERLHRSLEKLETQLEASESVSEEERRAMLLKANELCTVAEALVLKGVVKGSNVSAKLLASTEKVFRDLPIFPLPEAQTLRLAGNERGSFQLLLIPGAEAGRYLVETSNLRSENGESIPADEITLNPVAYLEVLHSFIYPSSREGWWPDPLLDNRLVSLDQKVQPIWVTVHVPTDQSKGRYDGTLTVYNENDESVLEIPYSVEVRGFSLPKTAALQNLFSCAYRPEDPVLRRKVYDTLLDYRINPIHMYINSGMKGYQPAREDLSYCIDRGLNTLVLWHPKNVEAEFPYDFDEAYLDKMNTFIRGYEQELKALNFWNKRAIVLGFDEVTHRDKVYADRAAAGARVILKNLRQNFPGLELASIGGPPLVETLTGPDNLWIPLPRIFSSRWSSEVEKMKNTEGSRFFLYWVYGDPGYMLDMPATSPRWTSWLAWQHGAAGIGYYSIIRKAHLKFEKAPLGVDWSHDEFDTETTRKMARNGCGTLVYPSPDGRILPSIRLASVRDGIQDYEYFHLLKELIEKKSGERFAALLEIPEKELYWNSFPDSIEPLLNRREQIATAIEELINQLDSVSDHNKQ